MKKMIYVKKSDPELKHYGIIGMHWGVRRFQNPDGTAKSYKDYALKRAKNDDMWNIDFVEAVQNKTYANSDTPENRKRMLSEYERFLDEGPENYEPRGKDV